MKEYCAVAIAGYCYCGSREDIVNSACEYIKIGTDRKLRYKVKGFVEDSRLGFTNEYTPDEQYKEAINHIFRKLTTEYKYRIYSRDCV